MLRSGRFSLIVVPAIILLMIGCSSPDQASSSMQEGSGDLLGMWVMGKVIQDTLDVTDEHNPALNRWITFNQAGTFESGGAPYGYNSGTWRFDVDTGELFLDSDAGEGDDSYWIVSTEDTTMQWQGTRSEFTSQFKLSFKKKGF